MQRTLVPALTLSLLGGLAAQEPAAKPKPTPDPMFTLTAAQQRATVHNKRVLAVLTEEADDLVARLKKDKALSRPLLYEFEIVQFAGNDADTVAVALGRPDSVQQKPVLIVADAAGKQLTALPAADFLADGDVLGAKLLEQLKPLYCAPVDAEKKLAAGIAEAKKTGRAVFVRFDAPW